MCLYYYYWSLIIWLKLFFFVNSVLYKAKRNLICRRRNNVSIQTHKLKKDFNNSRYANLRIICLWMLNILWLCMYVSSYILFYFYVFIFFIIYGIKFHGDLDLRLVKENLSVEGTSLIHTVNKCIPRILPE